MSKKAIILKIVLISALVLLLVAIGVKHFIIDNKEVAVVEKEVEKKEEEDSTTKELRAFSNLTWEDRLVNKDTLLPGDWTIESVDINNVAVLKKEKINKLIINEFINLVNAAYKDNIDLLVISAYRSMSAQKRVYNNAVNQYMGQGYSKSEAINKTEETINKPGASEHQTGLAVDVVGVNAWNRIGNLDERLADTKEFKWLNSNAYKYGFILRYPKDKVSITKVNYEPWHFRYVGIPLATYLTKNHLTLEEYHKLKSNLVPN